MLDNTPRPITPRKISTAFDTRDKSGRAMFYRANDQIAGVNELFMELLNHPTNPLTPADVDRLVARYPARYGRFAGFGTKKES